MVLRVFKLFCFEAIYLLFQPTRKLLNKSDKDFYSKFIFIISFPRSGTNALGSLLCQQNTNVNYFGEFFAFNFWNRKIYEISRYYRFFALRFILGFMLQKRGFSTHRFENLKLNPDKAMTALSQIPGTHVFKIFPTHLYTDTLESIIQKFKPDIIFIRRNHLDRLVSHKKAQLTGIWGGVNTEAVEVEIDEKELNQFIDGYQTFYQRIYQSAESTSGNILDVDYENLFDPETIVTVLNFIFANVKTVSNISLEPRTLKQDFKKTSQRNFLQRISFDGVEKDISNYNFHKYSH